jgi:hypothetical protein
MSPKVWRHVAGDYARAKITTFILKRTPIVSGLVGIRAKQGDLSKTDIVLSRTACGSRYERLTESGRNSIHRKILILFPLVEHGCLGEPAEIGVALVARIHRSRIM